MSDCHDKIKLKCGTKNFAPCVEYQSYVSPKTKLTQTTCLSLEDTTKDLYELIDEIKTEIDLSLITATCGTLPTLKNVKTLIQYLINRDCAQQVQIDALIAQNLTQASQILDLQANVCP